MESIKELVKARKKLVEEQTKLSNNLISALLEKLENEYDYSVADNNPEKFELKKEGNVCYLRDKEKGYIVFNNCIKTKKKGLVFNGKIIDFLEKDWAISVDIEKKKLLNVILLGNKEPSEEVDSSKIIEENINNSVKEKSNKLSKVTKNQEQIIIELYNNCKSLSEIAKKVPFSIYQLSFITRELIEQKKIQNREYYLGTYIYYSNEKEKLEKRNNIKKERDLSDKNNRKSKKLTKKDKVTKKTEELELKRGNFKKENQEVKKPKQEILKLVEECLNKKISLYNKQLEYYNNVEVKKERSQVVESIHFLLKSPFFNALFISLYLTIIFILITNYPTYTSIINIEVSEFWFITLVAIMASETIKYLLLKLE